MLRVGRSARWRKVGLGSRAACRVSWVAGVLCLGSGVGGRVSVAVAVVGGISVGMTAKVQLAGLVGGVTVGGISVGGLTVDGYKCWWSNC